MMAEQAPIEGNQDEEQPLKGRLRSQEAALNVAAMFGNGIVGGDCSREAMLIRNIEFGSRVGEFSDPANDFELTQPAIPPARGGYVEYRQTADGWETTFVDTDQEAAERSSRHIHVETNEDGSLRVEFDGLEGCDK